MRYLGLDVGSRSIGIAVGEIIASETKLDKTVHFVNETLSSFMATDILESQGLSIQEAKLREHQLAAQLILQQYLEENASS